MQGLSTRRRRRRLRPHAPKAMPNGSALLRSIDEATRIATKNEEGIGIPITTDPMKTNEAQEATWLIPIRIAMVYTKNAFGCAPMNAEALRTAGVWNTESWDAVKNQQHSGLQERRAMIARIPAMMPQRETLPRSHSGTFIPVMSTEE